MMKGCFFCTYKVEPKFNHPVELERFLTVRKKIVSSENSGVCAPHQRKLTKQIKYARFLSLIPYISYQKT